MKIIEGHGRGGSLLTLWMLGGLLVVLAAAASRGISSPTVPMFVVLVAITATVGRRLLTWRNLFLTLLIVILFVPIRRYTLSGSAGFQLEPYRLLIFLIVPLWLTSLLIDRRVRLRGIGFGAPVFAIVVVTIASIVVNTSRIHNLGVQSVVTKKLTFFLSFIVILYLIASVLRERDDIDLIVKVLVAGGAILSFFALVEFNTGLDIFNHINKVIPVLRVEDTAGFHSLEVRGGRLRVYGSGQHPIAYGAALLMLVPLGVYLTRRTRSRRWWIATVLLVLGTLTTVSRTSILMGVLMLIMYFRLFPQQVKRLWPLIIPAIVVIHVALPGALGTVASSFFPKGGVVKEQAAANVGSGRVASLAPGLKEAARSPFLGEGYGTRVVDEGPLQNATILDDQWLTTLLETGIFGLASWIWLFVAFTRRMMRRARELTGEPDAWLFAALGSSVAAYCFGLLFYDGLSFIQVTFFAFLLIALGSVLLRQPQPAGAAAAPVRGPCSGSPV
jgi:O-antigen ligase